MEGLIFLIFPKTAVLIAGGFFVEL